MPAGPYPQIVVDLTAESSAILAAFGQAESELSTQSAPAIVFLELYWTGSQIQRVFDSAQVSTLPQSEQYRLYPQLGGLFNAAMRKLLYP